MTAELRSRIYVEQFLETVPQYLTRPAQIISSYDRANLRPDLVAGLTIAVILLPQAIAYALVAGLPPAMGIYTAIVGAFFAALWGSSNQSHTGPTNAISLLVLSTLSVSLVPGSPQYIVAAGMLAIIVGIFQLTMGLARLGMLLTFVSHSVVVGFAAGAGVLIAFRQLAPLLGLQISAEGLLSTIYELVVSLPEINVPTAILGIGTIIFILVLKRVNSKLPAALMAMIAASILVFALDLVDEGVVVIGELPRGLPPLSDISKFDLRFIPSLSTGALAVAAIGLVEAMAISRTIATKTGQRLDSNQEFVGQGMANLASGLFSGYACSGSFTRTAVNYNAGGRSPIAAVSSSIFVLISTFFLGPMAAYLPRTALAGVLIVVSIGMINRAEMSRIWQGARGDAIIMMLTFLATLFLDLAFAVLLGIILSFAVYIMRTSAPRVRQVLPDHNFKHFTYQPDQVVCPQLGIIDILGDLYFGAVSHVEEAVQSHAEMHPEQRFLLIRMHNVNQCDFSGIHMLESVVRMYRGRGGDVFMVRVDHRVDKLMTSTGFSDALGEDNFLEEDSGISKIFHHKLDPAVCIYECPFKVFRECQNLPKQLYVDDISDFEEMNHFAPVEELEPKEVWEDIRVDEERLRIIDVREPREFRSGHIPGADLVPLSRILNGEFQLEENNDRLVILVCRSGRRSKRAARIIAIGNGQIKIVKGGMLAWEAAGLLEAVE